MLSDVTIFSSPHSTSRVRSHQQTESHHPSEQNESESDHASAQQNNNGLHKIGGL